MHNKIDMGLALIEMQDWQKISVDDDFTIVSAKEKLEQTLHCSIESNFLEILEPNTQSMLRNMVSTAVTDYVGCSIVLTLDGTPLEVLLTRPAKKLDIFFRNIEDRLRTLEHFTIFFRHFLTTPNAICFTDRDANIIDANKAFLGLFGYRLDEVVGKNPRILKSSRQSPSVYSEMWAAIAEGPCGSWSGEIIDRCKDGAERTVHLTISAVRRTNGCLIGYVACAIDLSREKRLEESLKARNEGLVELNNLDRGLMAITSRDVKSPLNSIISRASLIKETIDVAPRDKLLEQVEKIIFDCSRISAVVNDFFEGEKIEGGNAWPNTTRVHLGSILRTCIEINSAAASQKTIRITLELLAAPEPVLVEAAKMERVFNCLISNAVQFSPAGSVVSVVYRDCPGGKLVEIRDQGPGIPGEDLEAIFDRYLQVKKQGALPKRALGVGLSLHRAKTVVEQHGGKILAGNLPNGGCLFSVEIPSDRHIVSGRDIAALIHDPSGRIFQSLEGPLRGEQVCCFITKTDFEARRIFEYEKPDLVFVGSEAVTPELKRLLQARLETSRSGTEFILFANGEPLAAESLFSRVLGLPVQDGEVLGILKELRAKPWGRAAGSVAYSIVIMDNDDATHEVLGEYLRGAGYETRHACHPEEAFKLLASSRPDLILLDVQMPEMDDFRLFESMQGNALLRHVPVIFLSPDRPDGNGHGLPGGANYIAKPFSRTEVLARVKTALHASTRTRKTEQTLEGNLADVCLPELLQTLELGRKSARVKLEEMDGEICLADGMFLGARQGTFDGPEAFLRLFFLEKGTFSVQFTAHPQEHLDAPVTVQSLVMSGAAYLDEVRFLLKGLPAEGTVLDWAPAGEAHLELGEIFFPCPLQELLVQMKGDLKQNARSVASAFDRGLLRPSSPNRPALRLV